MLSPPDTRPSCASCRRTPCAGARARPRRACPSRVPVRADRWRRHAGWPPARRATLRDVLPVLEFHAAWRDNGDDGGNGNGDDGGNGNGDDGGNGITQRNGET